MINSFSFLFSSFLSGLTVLNTLFAFTQLESSTFRNVVWPVLKEELLKPWEKQTMDSLLLLLICQKHHKSVIKAKHLRQSLGTEDIMTQETLKHFAQRLLVR